MIKSLLFNFSLSIIAIVIILLSCSPKTTIKSSSNKNSEKTDECIMKDEICEETLDFQKEYNRMPEEEQKDLISVLSTYIKHCEEATKKCEKSSKQ